jgi:acyl carrier protein
MKGDEAMALSNAITKKDIYPMLVDMLHEMFELDKSKITLDANLYSDLDIDSIDAVDLAVKLKELTGKRLQPEVFKSVRTVQDVVDALAAPQGK